MRTNSATMNEPITSAVDVRAISASFLALSASVVTNVDLMLKLAQLALLVVTIGYTVHRWRKSVKADEAAKPQVKQEEED